jgi:hypothetical protein
MSTNNKTTSTNSYNPFAMGLYNGYQPMIQQAMQQNTTNSFGMIGGNQQMQNFNDQNSAQFGSAQQNNVQSLLSRGIAPNSPFFSSQINKTANANNAAASGNYSNLLLQSQQFQNQNYNSMLNYSPLQTGGVQNQTQGGLGSWLPQAIQGAGQAAMRFA